MKPQQREYYNMGYKQALKDVVDIIEKINPVDYGSMCSFKAHEGVRKALHDLNIKIMELSERDSQKSCYYCEHLHFNGMSSLCDLYKQTGYACPDYIEDTKRIKADKKQYKEANK